MIATSELAGLEALWANQLESLYDIYRAESSSDELALAAALVEVALTEQRLGSEAAEPAVLLVADLCLARASRILAEHASTETQIGFARTVEDAAAAGAEGRVHPLRGRIVQLVRAAR
ncbi:MAG TPA: hypothetical protein VF137_04275 [Candidatus Dormibacteraeota bacterium]